MTNKYKRLRELEELATPGIWFSNFYNKTIIQSKLHTEDNDYRAINLNLFKFPTRTSKYPISHQEWEANALFIAEARNQVPYLIQDYDEVLQKIEKLRFLLETHLETMEAINAYNEYQFSQPLINTRHALEKILKADENKS